MNILQSAEQEGARSRISPEHRRINVTSFDTPFDTPSVISDPGVGRRSFIPGSKLIASQVLELCFLSLSLPGRRALALSHHQQDNLVG